VAAGQIIVSFRGNAAQGTAAAAQAPDIITAKALMPARTMLLRSGSRSVDELLQEYSARPDVVYAEPNYIWHKNDIPNDVFFSAQWALKNTGQSIAFQSGVAGADIHAVEAWDLAQGSRTFVIGIVDSGFDYNHPDLAANIWSAPHDFTVFVDGQSITCAAGTHGFNAIAKNCDPMDDDPDRHGTHVAGIIGADGDNGLGITGVNRVASMMALKFLGPDGTGTTTDAIAAIEFAIQAKATLGVDADIRILNNSWGSDTFSLALQNAVNSASNDEMLFVAAAGNDSANNDTSPHFPANYNAPNIISVAATTNRDELEPASNYGASRVHLGAPGRDIASTRPVMTYVFETGTSMAAAMVSGAAGLVLSRCTGLTTTQLRANLISSVDPVLALQNKTSSGGRLNVYNALLNCAGPAPSSFTLKSSSPFILPGAGGSATTTISLNPINGFSSDVTLSPVAPAGFSVSLSSPMLTAGLLSTTLTVTADASVVPGTYVIHVSGTGGGIDRTAGLAFIVGSPLSTGQNLVRTWNVDASQPDRFRPGPPPGLAEWYQFALNSTSSVDISLLCFSFQGNALRLLDSSGIVLATTTSSSNNVLEITRTLNSGVYFIVASTGLTSDTSYSLAVNAPQLRSLSPFSGEQNSSVNIQLNGVQFMPGLTVDAGPDIAVSNVVFNQPQQATATFAISANAALGDRPVSVSTTAGTSNTAKFTVILPRPVIISISPSSVVVGTSVDITILGANFTNPSVQMFAGSSSATLDNVVIVNSTTITATVAVALSSSISNPTIQVTTLGGSATRSIQILPLPPVLTSITPSLGSLGSVVDVTLIGDNFFGPITVNAGSGITVTNVSIVFNIHTTATARFTISPTTTVGNRGVTITTPGGTTTSVSFAVIPAPPPNLASITPVNGAQTTTRVLDVRGTNFTTGFVFDVGPDIAVTSTTLVSITQATVSLQIGSTAALGPRDVRVTTSGGTSNTLVFTVLIPPPTLTTITPSSGVQQSTANMTLTGTNFVPGLTIQAAALTFSQINVINSTSATALLTIPVSTPTGIYNVTVVTPSGSSGSLPFTVLPGVPTLTSISPTFGIRGRDTNVFLTGSNFATGSTTISPIPGVNITNTQAGGGSVGAIFSISPSAPLGPHDVTVTTPGGTTGAVTFSTFDPFPDLSISGGPGGQNLFAGLTGTYSIFLRNLGTATATTITITDVLPPEVTFVSGGGNGFSCSANGQLVTCAYSGVPFTPMSVTVFTITVTVSATAPASLTHTISVPLAEDMVPSNNTAIATLTIQQVPSPSFSFTPPALTAGQQATVALKLPTALPQDFSGTLTLTFSSSTSIPADDAAIQFATGGRQVTFVIPANTLQARFGNASTAGPIGFQTGTVAGSIAFNGTAQAGAIQKSFDSGTSVSSLTIAPTAPVVQTARTNSQGGFAILVNSSSTALSVTEMALQFFTSPAIQLGCGTASGCTVSGSTLTFDVKTLFDNWYATSSQFGSLSTLRLPLSLQGSVHGTITVTLRNTLGTSNTISVPLP